MIDCRVRPPTPGFVKASMYADSARTASFAKALGFDPAPSEELASVEGLTRSLLASGMDTAVIPVRYGCGGKGNVTNEEILDFCRTNRPQYSALVAPDPALSPDSLVADVVNWMEHPEFVGVNLEPGYFVPPRYIGDDQFYPLYSECSSRGWPIVMLVGGNAGPDLSFSNPEHLDRVLAAFPSLQIIAGHGGWPWIHQMIHLAFRRDNLFLCPDMYWFNVPGSQDLVAAANSFLKSRLLFGSNYPFLTPTQALAQLKTMGLDQDAWHHVTELNPRRVFKMDAQGLRS